MVIITGNIDISVGSLMVTLSMLSGALSVMSGSALVRVMVPLTENVIASVRPAPQPPVIVPLLKVQPPSDAEIATLRPGSVLLSFLRPLDEPQIAARLAQAGLLEPDGMSYRLSAQRRPAVQKIADSEEAIRAYARQHGRIGRPEVMDLCQVSARQASYLLRKLVGQGVLIRQGTGRGTSYGWPETNKTNK